MNPQNTTEARLAWILWNISEELNSLLWKHFHEEFMRIVEQREEKAHQRLSKLDPLQ